MGLFDWLEIGATSDEASQGDKAPGVVKDFEKFFSGAFSITMGDSLNSLICGGQQYHVYGDNFTFVLDWEAFLKGLFDKLPSPMGGLASAAIFGVGGNATYVYGDQTALLYGQDVQVSRSVKAAATGKNYLWDWFAKREKGLFKPSELGQGLGDAAAAKAHSGGTTWFEDAPSQETIDKIIGTIAGIVSALMILIAFVMELVVYIRYTMPKPDGNTNGNEATGPEAMQSLLRAIDWTITSRIAAIIAQIEMIGQATRDANKDLWICATFKSFTTISKRVWAGSSYNELFRGKVSAEILLRDKAAAEAAFKKYSWVVGSITIVIGLIIAVGAIVGLSVGITEGESKK